MGWVYIIHFDQKLGHAGHYCGYTAKGIRARIATNPAPEAIFDPLTAGFNIWATPTDHPAGHEWNDVVQFMDCGAYTKKCAFVGTAWYDTHNGVMELDTDTYIMQDRLGWKPNETANRFHDLEWCKRKIEWVFAKMGVICPPIKTARER